MSGPKVTIRGLPIFDMGGHDLTGNGALVEAQPTPEEPQP